MCEVTGYDVWVICLEQLCLRKKISSLLIHVIQVECYISKEHISVSGRDMLNTQGGRKQISSFNTSILIKIVTKSDDEQFKSNLKHFYLL